MTNSLNLLADHFAAEGYHPRSDKHSNFLAEIIVKDLLDRCPRMRERAKAGRLCYQLNHRILAGTADWNIDLVLGPASTVRHSRQGVEGIVRGDPLLIQVAVEIKAVMTEHNKAIRNRKRDLEAHHEHVHNYSEDSIAGGVVLVNAAPTFKSPLRPEVTIHRNAPELVAKCLRQIRSISVKSGGRAYGLDALCAIVVDVSNAAGSVPAVVSDSRAPAASDPISYEVFLHTLCAAYMKRFGSEA